MIRFFLCAFGVGLGWAFVIGLFAVYSERPDRDRRLREEGYDSCVYDILHFGEYWDRQNHKYVKVGESDESS